MHDLIAVTIGGLSFIAWSAGMVAIGWYGQQRRQQREQRLRIARMVAEAQTKAAQAPAKMEPRHPEASDAVRRRSHA